MSCSFTGESARRAGAGVRTSCGGPEALATGLLFTESGNAGNWSSGPSYIAEKLGGEGIPESESSPSPAAAAANAAAAAPGRGLCSTDGCDSSAASVARAGRNGGSSVHGCAQGTWRKSGCDCTCSVASRPSREGSAQTSAAMSPRSSREHGTAASMEKHCSWCAMRQYTSAGWCAQKGRWPNVISYSTTPTLHQSAAGPYPPGACVSGATESDAEAEAEAAVPPAAAAARYEASGDGHSVAMRRSSQRRISGAM